jgi:hypothetical protein
MAGLKSRAKTHTGTATLLIGAVALAHAISGNAHATVKQSASILHFDSAGTGVSAFDPVTSPPDALRGVSAALAGPGYIATASVGPFGNLGIAAQMSGTGTLSSQILISNDEFTNPLSIPQRAEAHFIVDGGLLAMLAGNGSRLFLSLEVGALVRDANGLSAGSETFSSLIQLEQTVTDLEFLTDGRSLGATFDGQSRVDIPLSLQSLDLGLIPGNGSILINYEVLIRADVDVFSEFVVYQFSDPLQVDGTGEFPTVIFSAPAVVPEPSGFLALAAGLALFGASRCRGTGATRRLPPSDTRGPPSRG